MLWAYVDESGLHDKANRNRYTHLGVGGAIAELPDWERLGHSWKQALDDERLCEFHMVHFEHSTGEFSGWSKERREKFLRRLLAIILDNKILACMGVATNAPQEQEGHWLPPVYKSCVKGLTIRLIREVDHLSDEHHRPIRVEFAQHQEIRLQDLVDYVGAGDEAAPGRITVATGKPREVLPLQVADLVMYETLRWFLDPNRTNSPRRYPLRHLKENGMRVFLDARLQT